MTIRSMSVTESQAATTKRCCGCKSNTLKKTTIWLLVILVVVAAAVLGYLVGSNFLKTPKMEIPDPLFPLPPSASRLRVFQKAAVCTDAPACSEIGRSILLNNGSAVDAAIAAMFCNGLLNHQSMGIGGGHFMTVYIKDLNKVYSVIARETAPAAATQNMFEGDSKTATKGPLAVAVPGEVAGMWLAHRTWGVLPWADLIAPTIDICNKGFMLSKIVYNGMLAAPYIINDTHLRKQFYDENRKAFASSGSIVKPNDHLCKTFQRIAENGGDDFYNGSLAMDLANDFKRAGSIITYNDLKNYRAKLVNPIEIPLGKDNFLYSPPPPASGVLLGFILNILSGYNFTSESIANDDTTVLTYHRIIEAFKYAYATRTKLGDSDFLDFEELIQNISSVEYASQIREKINDAFTSNSSEYYGATKYSKDDQGTAHISVMAPNGDAVSVTSSINYFFGSGFTGRDTGILFNNVMDDFSSPGITNYFGIEPSPANFIEPGKRPLSSMSPTIILDENGNAKMVIGASGGTKITTAVATVIIRKLWFDQSIKEAVDAPRFHNQIFPMNVDYELGLTQDIVAGLRAKGHGMVRTKRGSIVCGLFRNKTAIYGNADFAKGGDVSGLN